MSLLLAPLILAIMETLKRLVSQQDYDTRHHSDGLGDVYRARFGLVADEQYQHCHLLYYC